MDFLEKLTTEFKCAVSAVLGELTEEDQKLEQGAKLSEIISESDLLAIFRKMKFYIYD